MVLLDYESGDPARSFEVQKVIEDNPVLVAGTLVATTRGRTLVALNVATGKLAWERNDRRWASPRLAVVEDGILVGATDGTLAVIDPLFGESVWEHELKGLLRGFVAEGDSFYAGNQDGTGNQGQKREFFHRVVLSF